MSEGIQSILAGTVALTAAAVAAVLLTLARSAAGSTPQARAPAVRLFLIGIGIQGVHFAEEWVTGFYERLPALLGLVPWSSAFFVSFNGAWIAVWLTAAVGVRYNQRLAFFPVWFFCLAMMGNGIAHPLLAVAVRGYFPGLVTSPLVGIFGLLLWRRLWELTSPGPLKEESL